MIAHYVHNNRPIDWTEARRRCEELIRKDREHGHKTKLKAGNWVRTPDGREGRLVHCEFMYHSVAMNRNVWLLEVNSGDRCMFFTDTRELRVVPEPKRVSTTSGDW